MKISRLTSATALALTLVTSVAAVQPAAARDRLPPAAAAALGVLGGLAVGGAIAASQSPAYAAPVYAPPPPRVVYDAPTVVYDEPPPAYVEHCVTRRYSEWVPGWGWEPHRRTVCR